MQFVEERHHSDIVIFLVNSYRLEEDIINISLMFETNVSEAGASQTFPLHDPLET